MKKGFTLIELLVVVLIIAILATVAVPQYQLAVEKSRYASYKNYANLLYDAIQRYHLENGVWTEYISQLDVDLPGRHIWRNTIFLDGTSTGRKCYIWYDGNGNNGYVSCGTEEISHRRSLQTTPKVRQCTMDATSAKATVYRKVCESDSSLTQPSSTSGNNKYLHYKY